MGNQKLIIGVTDCSKYANYSKWVLSYPEKIEVIKLSHETGNLDDLKKCHAVVLTGGEDVHPRFYHKPEYFDFCYKDDVNEARDEFEWKVLEFTESKSIPLLGICRGLQVANVFFGGTLIPDICTWGKYNHSKISGGKDRYHEVQVDPTSWLAGIAGATNGKINSNHHQSADKIGSSLMVSAFSPDGIIEAIERKEVENKSFLCLVQWHPERMADQDSGFVKNIREAFIKEAKSIANLMETA